MRWLVPLAAVAALAACSRDMSVPPARPLTLSPGSAAIAPRQRVTFVAAGGAGGYRFALSGSPGSGADAAIDAATGEYRAGSSGPGADVVEVVDLGGARASATVTVGARLAISPQSAVIAPGGSVTFAASGGLGPYTFSFQEKGNRSAGRIDAVTGEYTAGPNPGTQDRIQVTDVAGAVAQPQAPVQVGALQLPLPGGASELELGDLNGDGRRDIVSLEPRPAAGTLRRVTTTLLLGGGAAASEAYYLTNVKAVSAADLTGDGRADVLPGTGGPSTIYFPDPSGHLVAWPVAVNAAAPRLPYVAAEAGACTGGAGIYRLNWSSSTASFDPATCMTPVPLGDLYHLVDVAAGDFDRNGTTDVAWLEQRSNLGPYGWGADLVAFATATPRTLPFAAGWSFPANVAGRQQLVAGNFTGAGYADTAVLLSSAASRNAVDVVPAFTTGTAPAWAGGAIGLDPFPGDAMALGIARCPALPGASQETLVSWNGTGKPALVSVDATGVASRSAAQAPSVLVPITVGACADLNGDGVPDLALASDSTSSMAIAWGDGDGGFGRRPHFQSTPAFTMAQVDGDGVGDVIVATGMPSLATYAGDEHQLAKIAETPLTVAPAAIWAGDLGGATVPGWAGDVVIADSSNNLYTALGGPDGFFRGVAPIRAAPPGSGGRPPRILRVAFAELGGTAPGKDLAVLYELEAPVKGSPAVTHAGSYELDAIVRSADGSVLVVDHLFQSYGPDVQPVGLDGDAVDELVIANGYYTPGPQNMWTVERYRVDLVGPTMTAIGNASGYVALPGGDALPMVAVGRVGDAAVFTSRRQVGVVWGAGTDPSVATSTLPGGLATPLPNAAAKVPAPGLPVLAHVTSPAGPPALPDLVFADPNATANVHVLPGVAAGGRLAGFGAPTTARAPGVLAGILSQGSSTRADVLVFTGEELIPLVWSEGALR